jgi:4-aminobutyrate aminotransferase / (S)-3-amino-2-methylpropionate transaminase / 5-aminovalerate transaminase
MKKYNISVDPIPVPKIKTKYRNINTDIPAVGTKDILDRLSKVESRSMHGQLPIVWNKAENFSVFDIAGNKWIDFTSAIFFSNVGHSNVSIKNAITKSINNSLIGCYAYANVTRADYYEKLIEFAGAPFEKGFLLSAGTEATEAAFKLMRMNSQKLHKHRPGIICIDGNWHGRTMGAQMMSGNKIQKEWIGFNDPNIHHIPFPYPWIVQDEKAEDFLEEALNVLAKKGVNLETDICGVMLETFQGWGAIFYPISFVKAIKKVCEKFNILLCFDEMQSGFSRTGKNFGFKHYDVEPDLICMGKGMGGGIPLSGVLGKAEIMDLPSVGNMSSTHSANPLACSVGLAVIEEIYKKNLTFESERKGIILNQLLINLKNDFPEKISYTFCKGLIASIIFKIDSSEEPDPYFASRVAEKCMQKGLLVVHTGRESIKLGPPLIISDDALIEGMNVIYESIQECIN